LKQLSFPKQDILVCIQIAETATGFFIVVSTSSSPGLLLHHLFTQLGNVKAQTISFGARKILQSKIV